MGAVTEWLAATAATVTAVTILAGAVGWLVWPRIAERFEAIARGVQRVEAQTASEEPDSLAGHARQAASAVSELRVFRTELRELRAQLGKIAEKQRDLDAWQVATENRLGKLEETLIALMSDALRRRIRPDDPAGP